MSGGSSGDSAVAQAAAGVEQMSVSDATKQASGQKTWEQIVEEKKPYYQKRVDLFTTIKEKQNAALEAAKAANVPIKIVLPDGSEKPGVKGVTTPFEIASSISKSLAKKTIVAKVDGGVWDLNRPLENDCALQLLSFDDPDGKEVRNYNQFSCHIHQQAPFYVHSYFHRASHPGRPLTCIFLTKFCCRLSGTLQPIFWDKLWSLNLVLI